MYIYICYVVMPDMFAKLTVMQRVAMVLIKSNLLILGSVGVTDYSP